MKKLCLIFMFVVFSSALYSFNLSWMNNYQWEGGYHSREELHWGIVTSDNNFVGCGEEHYRTSSNSFEILLIKVDTLGNEIWHKFHSNDNRAKIAKNMKETQDKGFIIVGFKSVNNDSTAIYLLKTDSLGDGIWERLIFNDSISKCKGYDIEIANDGGYVIVGYVGGG